MLQYRIYRNDGAGGAVDFTTPYATVTVTTWAAPALTANADWTYVVRAYDSIRTLEEANSDVRIRIRTDASNVDVSTRPDPVVHAQATANSTTAIDVVWAWPYANPRERIATGFKVWANTGGSVNYGASPLATVARHPQRATYQTKLSGLTPGSTYRVGIRAYNADGNDVATATEFVIALPSGAGPTAPEAAAAVPSWAD